MILASILLLIKLIPVAFIVIFATKLLNWVYLTFVSSNGALDLNRYGGNGRSKRAWALITGASDGIGAAFAKVKRLASNFAFDVPG
jgi:hypothetical protein